MLLVEQTRVRPQVANVYLVASGLPSRLPRAHHARALAEFCVEVLRVLVTGLPSGFEPVMAKAGIHVGPVTAGVIGRTRRYYRVFGDTGAERTGVALARVDPRPHPPHTHTLI